MKPGRLGIKIFLIYIALGSTDAHLSEKEVAQGRAIAGYGTETAKHLSSAYVGFYHRHDSAGCMHTGLALASLPGLQISEAKAAQIKERLTLARQYCLDDRVPRAQVIKVVRDSLKIISGHSLVTTD